MNRGLRFACLLLFGTVLFSQGRAQCLDNVFSSLDVNKVNARFNNGANRFWDMYGASRYEVPKGGGKHSCFAGGFWIGGLDAQDQLHVAASTYRQAGQDFYAGAARTGTPYSCPSSVETQSDVFYDGIRRLSNGKFLLLSETDVVIYDPVTRQSLFRPLPAPRMWMDAVELPDGRIFLFGDDIYPTKNPVLFMDTVNYAFTGGPTLHWFHQESTIDLLPNGKVLMAGVVGCEVFDPATNLSSVVPGMIYPRTKHGSAKLPNGDIITCGGGNGVSGSGYTLYLQRFDANLGYWFPVDTMAVPRQRGTITALPNGKYFICGGTFSSKVTEIYDPAQGTLVLGAELPIATNAHSVAVLDSENVIIAAESVTGSGSNGVFKFNIYTGTTSEIHLQRSGQRSILLNPSELLLEVWDRRHFQRININNWEHDDDRWQYIWNLKRTEIDQFRADFQAGTVNFAHYPQIANWPAHGDEGVGEQRNLAPFEDVNGDGLYRPEIDGDYPCIVGDQALWWVMNDQQTHTETQGLPLGIQVESMAYAFDCGQTTCPDTSLDYATFLHFEITNVSGNDYHKVFLGNYHDIDLGSYSDDYIGCDSSLGLGFGYNGDNSDIEYGTAPPAWGSAIMPNGQIDSMSTFFYYENAFVPPGGVPQTPLHYYNYMQSILKDSSHVVNNGANGLPTTAPGPVTNFMFPSTEGFCAGVPSGGWNEITANIQPFDRSFLQSVGPVDLPAGGSVQFDIAFLWARDSSNLASVCKLQAVTATVKEWWKNQLDRGCFNKIVGLQPRVDAAPQLLVYPNPAGGSQVRVEWDAQMGVGQFLELLDMQGRLLQRKALDGQVAVQDLSVGELPAGIYLVRLLTDQGAVSQRLVVE